MYFDLNFYGTFAFFFKQSISFSDQKKYYHQPIYVVTIEKERKNCKGLLEAASVATDTDSCRTRSRDNTLQFVFAAQPRPMQKDGTKG